MCVCVHAAVFVMKEAACSDEELQICLALAEVAEMALAWMVKHSVTLEGSYVFVLCSFRPRQACLLLCPHSNNDNPPASRGTMLAQMCMEGEKHGVRPTSSNTHANYKFTHARMHDNMHCITVLLLTPWSARESRPSSQSVCACPQRASRCCVWGEAVCLPAAAAAESPISQHLPAPLPLHWQQ